MQDRVYSYGEVLPVSTAENYKTKQKPRHAQSLKFKETWFYSVESTTLMQKNPSMTASWVTKFTFPCFLQQNVKIPYYVLEVPLTT